MLRILQRAYRITVGCTTDISQNRVQTEERAYSMNTVGQKPHVQNVIQRNCSYVFFRDSGKVYSN